MPRKYYDFDRRRVQGLKAVSLDLPLLAKQSRPVREMMLPLVSRRNFISMVVEEAASRPAHHAVDERLLRACIQRAATRA